MMSFLIFFNNFKFLWITNFSEKFDIFLEILNNIINI